uniref:Secreted protein n=1 Tax=Heterorhabditis bacteriophora TaxID=37862 RepID=A0A1I7WJT4_HETBA
MVLMFVTPIGRIYARNPDSFQPEISVEEVLCGTGQLGVCLEEDEQQGIPGCLRTSSSPVSPTIQVLASLSNKIMPPSTPVEAPRPGWRTMMWPLWTGHHAPLT